jgi:hypothetical protein
MATRTASATISPMVNRDGVSLCEHDREPDNCPICAEQADEDMLDPLTRAVTSRPAQQRADEIVELTGVPLS